MRASRATPMPLTVLGGFLGAGKTTLVNALLRQATGLRIAVLVNDFGAVNIDAALIAEIAGDTIALTNGCICCAVGDDLAAGLAAVLDRRAAPDHLLVECSGVADPAAIAAIAAVDPDLMLAGVVVLADVTGIASRLDDPLLADTVRRQLRAAELLVLTKSDLLEDDTGIAALLRPLAPRAALTRAMHGALPIGVALGEHAAGPRPAAMPARHGDSFATLTLRPGRPVDPEALRAAFDAAPDGLLRAKGILPLTAGRRGLVQRVGRRLDLRPEAPPGPEALVLIGTGTAPWDAAAPLAALGLR
jgi:G3E family GTPase